ncbi:MAG TPA: BTAD domain-containing putative transcriptional regulator [Actinocrinis sp.]|nr:BTAD domain-containing putative transcriptional regulator [Actinocrinis sp.]
MLLTVRGLFAGVVGAVILVGLPWGLIRYIGWPLPHRLPSLGQLRTDLTSPILGDQVYLNALAIVLWFLWLLIVISVLIELGALLRRTERPSLPAMSPFQALAFLLLTAIGLTALMARAAAPAQAATATLNPTRAAAPTATAPARPGPQTPTASTTPHNPSLTDPAERVHTVEPGENLYEIARADYGNGRDWPTLAALNHDVVQADGQRLTNPDLIRPGWRLITIAPTTAVTPAAPAPTPGPTTGAPALPPTSAPAAPTPEPASGGTSHATTGTRRPGSEPDAGANQAPAQTTSQAQDPSAPTRPEHPGAPAATADGGRIRLADGGALAGSVLLALAGALEASRRHRRRFASPYWPVRVIGAAPGAAVMPPPLRPAHRAPTDPLPESGEIDQFGAPDQDQDQAPGAPDEVAAKRPTLSRAHLPDHDMLERPARIAVASAAGGEITLDQLGPGLGLSGPGALGAARAIALAALSTETPGRAGARLLISRPDAALLLESTEAHAAQLLAGVPGVELADTATQAADYLDEYLTYRARQLDEHECESLDQLAADHGDLEEHPPLVLLGVARADTAGRLAASLTAGSHLRAHAVLLGAHPSAPTWAVDTDGRVTGSGLPGHPIAFDLPPTALHQALALLAGADGFAIRDHEPHPIPDPTGPLADPAIWDQTDSDQTAPFKDEEAGDLLDQDPAAPTDPTSARPEQEVGAGQPAPDPETTRTTVTEDRAPEAPGVVHHLPLRPHSGYESRFEQVDALTRAYYQAPLRARVLGDLVLENDQGPVLLKRGAVRQLAGRLAVYHSRAQSFDQLAVLWPDLGPKSLQATRKNAASELRTSLRRHTGARATQFVLTQGGSSHRFDPAQIAVDLDYFDRLRRLARRASDPAERAAAAQAALDLYHGDLLAGSDEEWVIAPRAGARRDALATATLLGQLAEHADDPEGALAWWERGREIDENEEVYRQIMRLQAHLGRRADVIATRDLLIARLEPQGEYLAPATERLLAEILSDRFRPTYTGRCAAA